MTPHFTFFEISDTSYMLLTKDEVLFVVLVMSDTLSKNKIFEKD